MKHYGDITQIRGDEVEPVMCVIGGSPCQDLSIAGKRKGLDGERSGLFMEQIRIIREMRAREQRVKGTDEFCRFPRYGIWENVPGAMSSNGGEDFRAVLEEFARVAEPGVSIPVCDGGWQPAGLVEGNGWQIAWRIHDAQYWGVAQRRRRIALVVDFDGYNAATIVFDDGGVWRGSRRRENHGQVERDIGTKPGQEIRPIKSGDQRDNSQTERKEQGHTPGASCGDGVADGTRLTLYENHAQDARVKKWDNVAPQVSATYGSGGGVTRLSWCIDHQISTGGNSGAQGRCIYAELSATLKAGGTHSVGTIERGSDDASVLCNAKT